jgi:hypothetical protein
MKNVKYEEVYPCMHNHSTRFCSLIQGEKLMDLLFYFSNGQTNGKKKREITNLI